MSITFSEKSMSEGIQLTSTSNGEKGLTVKNFYEGLKSCLNNREKTYKEKIDALSTAWEMLAFSDDQSSPAILYLYRDTIMLVLQSEWGKLKSVSKTHLKVTLQNAVVNLFNTHACHLCQRALRVVTDPWNHPVVIKIINDLPISEFEGRDFFLTEMPILLTSRLDRKCFQDSRCLLEPVCSLVCQQLWLDLHVTLLYICNETDDFVIMLERHFSEGYDLVNRLIRRTAESFRESKENSGINRIWRVHGKETAEFASRCLLSTALILCPPPNNLSLLAIQFVNLQIMHRKSNQDITTELHKLINNDQLKKMVTPAHLYVLGASLSNAFPGDFKAFAVELYIEAVAADLNNLESQKLNQNGEEIKIAEIGLATAFSKLAEFVRANLRICREIALTAFSLHPTKERFDKLEELVREQIAKEKSEFSTLTKSPSEIVERETEMASNLRLEKENQLPYSYSDAIALGLSEPVIRDLASIVHSVRWDVLTWKNGWKELEPLCRRYMVDKENMRSVTKELLFLKVDYNQFKDMPRQERDVNWGIEKGYEKCLESRVRFRKNSRCKRKLKRKSQSRTKLGVLARKKSLKSRSFTRGRSKQKTVTKRRIRMHHATESAASSTAVNSDVGSQEGNVTPEINMISGGVKRSARIKTRKLRNARLLQEAPSLVKRLREIRLKPENMELWQTLCVTPGASQSTIRVPAEPPRKGEQECSGSAYENDPSHFAPMLSTLDMQPRVVLTRISIPGKSNERSKASGNNISFCGSDSEEFHLVVENATTNKTKQNSVEGITHPNEKVMELKGFTENILEERYNEVSCSTPRICSPKGNGTEDRVAVQKQEEPSSSTFNSLLSLHDDPNDLARSIGDIHLTPFTSFPDFATCYSDPDPLLPSSPSVVSFSLSPYQSEGDSSGDVSQLDTAELLSGDHELQNRSINSSSSDGQDDLSFFTPSPISANFPTEDDTEACPPTLQLDVPPSEQHQTREESHPVPGKRRKLDSTASGSDGAAVLLPCSPQPNQLRKQRERQWCPKCGFPVSDTNRNKFESQNEHNAPAEPFLPHKSSGIHEHLFEDCKKIQNSNQGFLAWIKWLQLKLNPEDSSNSTVVTEYGRGHNESSSGLLEDLNVLIAQLCDKSKETSAAHGMACDCLRLYCKAPLAPMSNDGSLLNLFDWFRLLIFQPEALSDDTNKSYVNVLAFLILLLTEEQSNPSISNRLDIIEHNFGSAENAFVESQTQPSEKRESREDNCSGFAIRRKNQRRKTRIDVVMP
ncbi:uncharacterized protein LOC130688568 isoform X2 [Daphnia carinata]|uniref:uncharacterized protein LOC130688568 isoform X2 n=1 Tax=Daphnia carinata TaxID=120202 RepID=UPI00257F5462|nr:uncharacterized protein LOC130688568 isoform X2 [Daphnia carinata]